MRANSISCIDANVHIITETNICLVIPYITSCAVLYFQNQGLPHPLPHHTPYETVNLQPRAQPRKVLPYRSISLIQI